ncbi:hypothetical protein MNBD_ALPHA06-952 [hydrothermal vent metagenome]|uniref:Uncharacterized protein n=1 Tax=hydrothermal vent metagenome TaxID=652676 RepID=A0A3B0RGA3_9ZZZZ
MTVFYTYIWLGISILLIGFAVWRDGKPRQNGKIYWFSWKPVILIGAVVVIVLVTHLLNAYGVETGQGRRRF